MCDPLWVGLKPHCLYNGPVCILELELEGEMDGCSKIMEMEMFMFMVMAWVKMNDEG